MAGNATVKKVKPYPFKATLKDTRGAYPGNILKLTLQGLLIEVEGTAVQPGERVDVNFVTPVLHGSVVLVGVVIKVYNQLTMKTLGLTPGPLMQGQQVQPGQATKPAGPIHLLEVHYKSVPPDSMSRIAMFLESTGQAKRGP